MELTFEYIWKFVDVYYVLCVIVLGLVIEKFLPKVYEKFWKSWTVLVLATVVGAVWVVTGIAQEGQQFASLAFSFGVAILFYDIIIKPLRKLINA